MDWYVNKFRIYSLNANSSQLPALIQFSWGFFYEKEQVAVIPALLGTADSDDEHSDLIFRTP